MKKVIALVVVLCLVLSGAAFAKKKASIEISVGAKSIYDGIGVGFIGGFPAGLSFKKWMNKEAALQAAIGYNGWWGGFSFSVDYLMHNYSIIKMEPGALPLYFGLGLYGSTFGATYTGYGASYSTGGFGAGIRVPLGISYIFETLPIDIFLECVPQLSVLPGIGFSVGGGVGARYYF